MTPEELAERDRRMEELILRALRTDGGHHKQWFLEQLLAVVIDVDEVYGDWEPGIAP